MGRRDASVLLWALLVAPACVASQAQPLPAAAAAAAAAGTDSYLFLVNRNNRPQAAARKRQQQTLCSGKKAGEPIDGRYMVFFDQRKVTSTAQGLITVQQNLQRQAVAQSTAAASTLPLAAGAVQPTTPALTFTVNAALTTATPLASASATSSSSLGSNAALPGVGLGRRLQQQRQQRGSTRQTGGRRPVTPPLLGAVVTVAPGAQQAAVVDGIKSTSTVQSVVQSVCVKVMETDTFSCLPATMLSSSIQAPVGSAAWAGCLTPDTWLAWWGQRCGSSLSQVQWMGVYAFDKATGRRLPACVKQRPAGNGTVSDDLRFWLGGCGAAPAAVPTLPTYVCTDQYVATSVVDADAQGCFETNFTDASQTLLLFHPTPGCGGGQPVSMVYRGRRCTSNGGGTTNSSQPGVAGVMWDAAEPAPGSGLSAAQCSLQRRTEASADDAIFNVDWFGSCGVPPARVQYARRSECPAPPPAPPPSPSPRPENEKGLDREAVMAGETVPTGIRRIQAVMPSTNASSGFDTVKLLNPTAIAVMDTGVDCFHRDLNVVFNVSFNERPPGNDPFSDLKGCWDVYDHGTNVAGVIGAKNNGYGVIGVMPGAAIVALKMLDSNGEGPSDNILKAALWLLQTSLDGVEANENNSTNADVLGVDVVNMSLGYPGSPYDPLGTQICRAMAALNDHGVALVAAAGNDGGPANNAMPAACAGVVSVTAIDQGDGSAGVAQAPAWFSNYLLLQGAGVLPPTDNKANLTVSAPGVDIYSTCFQQAAPFCSLSGTSQATPHVAGMLARCFSSSRCRSRSAGGTSTLYAVERWATYNTQDNPDYGYAADPIRKPRANNYYGYLANADVW